MIFECDRQHACGGSIHFSAYGDQPWKLFRCSRCGETATLMNPLSVSIAAERLLGRSEVELAKGDFSLSIVIGAMAVEAFLTRLFLKLKGMNHFTEKFEFPSDEQENEWELEYPRNGGFPIPADFVSKALTSMPFDDWVRRNATATQILATFPDSKDRLPKDYFQAQLFKPRNRIVHWGFLNSTKEDAEVCHKLAVAIVSILREMDRSKYGNL